MSCWVDAQRIVNWTRRPRNSCRFDRRSTGQSLLEGLPPGLVCRPSCEPGLVASKIAKGRGISRTSVASSRACWLVAGSRTLPSVLRVSTCRGLACPFLLLRGPGLSLLSHPLARPDPLLGASVGLTAPTFLDLLGDVVNPIAAIPLGVIVLQVFVTREGIARVVLQACLAEETLPPLRFLASPARSGHRREHALLLAAPRGLNVPLGLQEEAV
mmetsp:Transcript_40422/g.129817  ORF Transcript_40422/g.129817 Transcript_40422/m.129817 type:complete len:214 (-) Transcript_40422:171-812(-)